MQCSGGGGLSAPGEGVSTRGGSTRGGGYAQREVSAQGGGCASAQGEGHTLVKISPCPNFVAGGKILNRNY